MAIVTINYTNKSDVNTSSTPAANKVAAADMNEIKSVVNTNANLQGDLANLDTTEKSSIVGAVNEIKNEIVKKTLLWTNPNPNNTFAASLVTLSSSDYDILEIYYYDWGYDSQSWKDVKCIRTLKGYNTVLEAIISSQGKAYIGTRRVVYNNDTQLNISACYALVNENTFSSIISNAWCIPLEIYGYKY